MVVVEVWLHPKGDAARRQHLGTARISNSAVGDEEMGHYNVELSKWGRPNELWKVGHVENFPRQKLGPWDLLLRALRATIGHRNP